MPRNAPGRIARRYRVADDDPNTNRIEEDA